jgi:hypothetical protein
MDMRSRGRSRVLMVSHVTQTRPAAAAGFETAWFGTAYAGQPACI